jgi:hypothetical protein
VSVNAELAAAARWVAAEVQRLPEEQRPDVAAAWSELLHELDQCRSEGVSTMTILQWRQAMARRFHRPHAARVAAP